MEIYSKINNLKIIKFYNYVKQTKVNLKKLLIEEKFWKELWVILMMTVTEISIIYLIFILEYILNKDKENW